MAKSKRDALYWLRGHEPTELDWLHCQDRFFQFAMLDHLRVTKVPRSARGRRKLRMACRLCRWPGIWNLLTRGNRRTLDGLERQAESGKPPNVNLAEHQKWGYTMRAANDCVHTAARANAVDALKRLFNRVHDGYARNDHTPGASDWTKAAEVECLERETLREVFGNVFRTTKVDPAWHTTVILKLAQAAYDKRELPTGHLESTRLAVLADALEEAGCTDSDIVGHLRAPGPHVRGCWAVDLIVCRA